MSYIGTNKVGKMYLGSTAIGKAYLGEDLVYSASEPEVLEYPDAYMAIFDCEANTTRNLMNGNDNCISRYILDGVEYTPSTPVWSVTPTTSGTHILYFWLSKSQRLRNNVEIKYLRIPSSPTYWHTTFYYTSWQLRRIDFLGSTPPTFGSSFGFGNGTNTVEIRVPVGSGSAYTTALQGASNWIKTYGRIVESNSFSYTI